MQVDYTAEMNINQVGEDEIAIRQGVETIVASNPLVDYCNAYVWRNRVVVGIMPHPIYSRSQRDKLVQEIIDDLDEAYGFDETLISFDMDIVYEISKFNKKPRVDEKDASALFYTVKVRRN